MGMDDLSPRFTCRRLPVRWPITYYSTQAPSQIVPYKDGSGTEECKEDIENLV